LLAQLLQPGTHDSASTTAVPFGRTVERIDEVEDRSRFLWLTASTKRCFGHFALILGCHGDQRSLADRPVGKPRHGTVNVPRARNRLVLVAKIAVRVARTVQVERRRWPFSDTGCIGLLRISGGRSDQVDAIVRLVHRPTKGGSGSIFEYQSRRSRDSG